MVQFLTNKKRLQHFVPIFVNTKCQICIDKYAATKMFFLQIPLFLHQNPTETANFYKH